MTLTTVTGEATIGGVAYPVTASVTLPTGGVPSPPVGVGLLPGVTLTKSNSIDTSSSGLTISNMDYSGAAYPTIRGSNLTYRNCKFPGGIWRGGSGVTLINCEFTQDVYFSSYSNVLVQLCEVHTFEDGIDVTSDAGSMCTNIEFDRIYVHTPTPGAGAHSDGTQVRGVNGLHIHDSYYQMNPWFLVSGGNVLNSCIFTENANGGNTNVLIERNYLEGAGYCLYASGGAGSIINNTFGPNPHFGFVYPTVDPKYTAKGGNVDSAGHPVTF